MIKELDGKEWLPELPEVELHDAGDGVDVGGVGDVGQRVVAPLEGVPEVVDLVLGPVLPEHAVVVQPVTVDHPHAALDHLKTQNTQFSLAQAYFINAESATYWHESVRKIELWQNFLELGQIFLGFCQNLAIVT